VAASKHLDLSFQKLETAILFRIHLQGRMRTPVKPAFHTGRLQQRSGLSENKITPHRNLIEAGGVKGRRVTSYPSIQTDLRNAGAERVDQEVVTDNGLVTSRKPDDIPAFNRKMIEEFAEGRHQTRATSSNPFRSMVA
jgi:DJ-1/PfpI family